MCVCRWLWFITEYFSTRNCHILLKKCTWENATQNICRKENGEFSALKTACWWKSSRVQPQAAAWVPASPPAKHSRVPVYLFWSYSKISLQGSTHNKLSHFVHRSAPNPRGPLNPGFAGAICTSVAADNIPILRSKQLVGVGAVLFANQEVNMGIQRKPGCLFMWTECQTKSRPKADNEPIKMWQSQNIWKI